MGEENKLRPQTFEDWVERSPDIMALMYLKNKIEKLENAEKVLSTQNLNSIDFQEKTIKEISELKSEINHLKECNIADTQNHINIKSVLKEIKDNLLRHRLLPSNFDDYYKLDGEKYTGRILDTYEGGCKAEGSDPNSKPSRTATVMIDDNGEGGLEEELLLPKPSEPFNQEIYDKGWKQGYKEGREDGMIEEQKLKSEFLDFLIKFNDGLNYYEIEKEIEKWQKMEND